MRRAATVSRPDLVRARAVLEAMRGPGGKQLRSVVQAVAWIDKHRPELTDAWQTWLDDKEAKQPAVPVAGAAAAVIKLRRRTGVPVVKSRTASGLGAPRDDRGTHGAEEGRE